MKIHLFVVIISSVPVRWQQWYYFQNASRYIKFEIKKFGININVVINENIWTFFISSFVWAAFPREGGSSLFELPSMGIYGFGDHVCVQSLPVHPYETILPYGDLVSRNDRLWSDRMVWESFQSNSRIQTGLWIGREWGSKWHVETLKLSSWQILLSTTKKNNYVISDVMYVELKGLKKFEDWSRG